MASALAWRSASAIAGLVVGKLGELALDEATLMWTFKDDLAGLKSTMDDLQAWMHDADRRSSQGDGDSVRPWMNKLKSASSNVENLLDEFEAIELVRRSRSKMKIFFSTYNPLLVRLAMAHKMKKVKEDLDTVEKWGRNLHLVPYSAPNDGSRDQATIGEIDIGMVGRDAEKETIIKLLLEVQPDLHIAIIPIVGIGGLGKTTLAKAVFSDKRAKIFDLHVWIYVSNKIDLPGIGNKIISTVNNNINSGTIEKCMPLQNDDLDTIVQQLEKILPNKRYLIVLDDMWEEGFQNLTHLMQMLKHGAKGSKVILTTRAQGVVDKLNVAVLQGTQRKICPVRASHQINLNNLSDEESWSLMRQIVLGQDDSLGGLEDIGRQIAKRCRGLPLLVRSLGFLMSQPQHKSTKVWEGIRDTKIILSVQEGQKPISETLESLMLSYHYLQFNFKSCFIYCGVLPKGFTIARDHLIQQWAALGYIKPNEGHYCIDYLLGMSFLSISRTSQSAPGDDAEVPNKVTMHDLVYDLAQIILDKELIAIDASDQMTWSSLEKHYSRHMRLINCQKQSINLKEFPRKIRSLHFTECSKLQLQDTTFSKSKYLRVLDISGCSINGKPGPSSILLPSSIQDLVLLRYLDATGLPIAALPKSLHKLQNMQTLLLFNCALETLPDNIGCLLNLCYLDLSSNTNLNKLPMSFGELSTLSSLKLSKCSELKELPESIHKLKSLRHLDMSGCCGLQKLPDKFGNLPKLLFLNLSNCSELVKLTDSVNLNSLEHLNLSNCHELQSLPEDFGNLDKLKFLNLSDCYKIRVLPESFCQLKHLKHLDLSDCHNLKELPACFGNLSDLHYLNLTSCSKMKTLPESFGDLSKLEHLNLSYSVRFEKFPSSFCNLKLQTLYMSMLQSLNDFPDVVRNMTSITVLESDILVQEMLQESIVHNIHDVQEDYGWCSSIVNLGKLTCRRLRINGLDNVKHPEDAQMAKLQDNPDLRELTLKWCRRDTEDSRDAEVLENLIPPRTLEGFALEGYMSRNFPNWMVDICSSLPYLTSIHLYSLNACDSLPPLGILPNLRSLRMSSIPNIRKIGKEFYGHEGSCKKLRVIHLGGLFNLDEWWTTRSGDEDGEFLIPILHRLEVNHCPNLKFLPCPPKSIYWTLRYSDEVLPVHGFGRLSSSTLPFQAEVWSHDFSHAKLGRLQHLSTLEELMVISSGSTLSTFLEANPCFPSLRYLFLSLPGLEMLPEWLGQLTALEELIMYRCPKVTSLPASIRNLTTLKKLKILDCPILVERCKGEEAHKISHIPKVKFHD